MKKIMLITGILFTSFCHAQQIAITESYDSTGVIFAIGGFEKEYNQIIFSDLEINCDSARVILFLANELRKTQITLSAAKDVLDYVTISGVIFDTKKFNKAVSDYQKAIRRN